MKKNILYLGTNPEHFSSEENVHHYPVIKVIPRSFQDLAIKVTFDDIEEYTHLIFTSKHGVSLFFDLLKELKISRNLVQDKVCIVVGEVTAHAWIKEGFSRPVVAQNQTQEGILKVFSALEIEESAYFLYCRSSLARSTLSSFLGARQLRHQLCALYDIGFEKKEPIPDLTLFDEIVFTSPSTVKGFFQVFSEIPSKIKVTTIGPITEEALLQNQSI